MEFVGKTGSVQGGKWKKKNTKNYPIAYSTVYSVLSFIRITLL